MQDRIKESSKEIEQFLQIKTNILGIRMLSDISEIPSNSIRPVKDLGYHLSLCQAMAISRREGTPMTLLKEDMWCFEPVVGLGLDEPPQEFLDGENRYPESASSIQAGKNWARKFPRLELNRYIGITISPMNEIEFMPEIGIIYCDPSQLTHLLNVVNWIDGQDLYCQLSGHAGCVYAIVPSLKNKQYQVTSPCAGDRKMAAAQDYEIIFTFPIDRIMAILDGLKALSTHSIYSLPVKFLLKPEYAKSEKYDKIGKILGMGGNSE